MNEKNTVLSLIETLRVELGKREEKLAEIMKIDFTNEITEEINRLTAELNSAIETFKANLEASKQALVENTNLDICAINRIIEDKIKVLAEIEAAELATTQESVSADTAQ